MRTTICVGILLLLLASVARAGEESGPAVGLKAELIFTGEIRDGRAVIAVPFRGGVPLTLRITNISGKAIQISHSSYPFYYFFKLSVRRVGAEGEPLAAWPDLYPFKDMKMPSRHFVTLAPGEHYDRDMSTLLTEAYGLRSFAGTPQWNHFRDLAAKGYGAFRAPGSYVITGRWSPTATFLDGKPHDLFEGVVGRDESVPIWSGGPVTSAPLEVEVVLGRSYDALARAELSSAHIVRGVIRGDAALLGKGEKRYESLSIEVTDTLKGGGGDRLVFSFFTGDKAAVQRVAPRIGKETLIFLTESEGKLYLADLGDNKALLEPTDENSSRIYDVVVLHEELSRREIPVGSELAVGIPKLLEKVKKDRAGQCEGVKALLSLGPVGAPAIARFMDDRTPLPEKSITLENRAPGRFEAVRHYSPEQVVDALAAILNHLTGEQFGMSYNRATDRERDRTVRAWRVFAHYHLAE